MRRALKNMFRLTRLYNGAVVKNGHFIGQFLPSTLYGDITSVILNPVVQTTSRTITTSQALQAQDFFADSSLSVMQSLVLIWPQVVTLSALTIGCFALAYVRFMRQEVRA